MPDHVGISVIQHDDVEAAGPNRFDDLVGNLGRRHLGLQVVGRHLGRRNQNPLLPRENGLPPAVEKERDVRVFLGFGDAQLGQSGPGYHLAEAVLEILGRE